MKKIAVILSVLLLSACSSTKTVEKKEVTREELKNWDKTISKKIEKEAYIKDLYGDDDPIYYLRKTGKMSEKEFNFLKSLTTKKDITAEDTEKFESLLEKYPSKIERKFYLADNNLKNPKGLVDKMVRESYLRIANPSNHISNTIATEEEWKEIVEFSKKDDLREKEVKRLRKLLNKFMKRDGFFDERSWYGSEISERLEEIISKNKSSDKTKENINNINAKALYIAYPDYFSPLEKWDD